MVSWRRQKGESRHQGFQGTRSQSRKPPICSWQPTVPSWEKKFCSSVGSVPWHKLVEAKRFMHLYDNIIQWNDSAGEEAFLNAKQRFWAEMNGLRCDISLPDPDKYIDEVDWEASIDSELFLDLDREPEPFVEGNCSGMVIFGSALLDQSFSCTGWGDCDANFVKDSKVDEHNNNSDWGKNSWEVSPVEGHTSSWDQGWGTENNGWQEWNNWDNNDFDKFGSDYWKQDEKFGNDYWNQDEKLGNDYWKQDEKPFSGGLRHYHNWSDHRKQKQGRWMKRNDMLANTLRT